MGFLRKIVSFGKVIYFYVGALSWDNLGKKFEDAIDKHLWELGIRGYSVGIDVIKKVIIIYCYEEVFDTPLEELTRLIDGFIKPLGGRIERVEEK